MLHAVALFMGTRPEAIKLAPLARTLLRSSWAFPVIITTGQHGSVVDDVLELFGLSADHRIPPPPAGTMAHAGAHLLREIDATLTDVAPDQAVVQGDTLTAFVAAFGCYLRQIPVVHVEAGLRSGRLDSPFPEEGNRQLISRIAALHLAPTARAAENLKFENVPGKRIVVTGNTVVDALHRMTQQMTNQTVWFSDPLLKILSGGRAPLVVVTAHRRESWGEPIRRIGQAVARLAATHPGVNFLVATHMNPDVRRCLVRQVEDVPNIHVSGPVPYLQFTHLLSRSALVITDSGGIQEECAALGLPVVVTRENTERVELLESGLGTLAGTDPDAIVAAAEAVLGAGISSGPPRKGETVPAFGDGTAAVRCALAMHDFAEQSWASSSGLSGRTGAGREPALVPVGQSNA